MDIILITLHGGCFIGGNSSYDKEQTSLLSGIFKHVFQLDFVKTNLESTIADLKRQIHELKEKYTGKKFYVLGRSSGGYLAKVLFDAGLFEKAIYLCPVFNPILRGQLVKHLGEKASAYFKDQHVYLTNSWDTKNETLYLASNDQNVPNECFTDEQLKNAIYVGPITHTGMIECTSKLFVDSIMANI